MLNFEIPSPELLRSLGREQMLDLLPGRIGNQRGLIEATAESLPALSEADGVPCGGEDPSGAASNGGESAGEDLRRRR
jgi:hypothetical protein